jgi:hypothetical protein
MSYSMAFADRNEVLQRGVSSRPGGALKTIPETLHEINLRIKQMKEEKRLAGYGTLHANSRIYLTGYIYALRTMRDFIYRKSRAKK